MFPVVSKPLNFGFCFDRPNFLFIASIDKFIGKEYSRVRIGIGKPENKISVSDYVLNDFNEDEQVHLDSITSNIIESLTILIDKKLDLFSSTVNNN